MPFEHEIGTLIRRMNPYTDGTRGSMHFLPVGLAAVVAPDAAASAAAATAAADAAAAHARRAADAARAAAAAIAAAAPDAADAAVAAHARARAAADAAVAAAEDAADAADPLIDLTHIDVGVDNNYTQEYLTWTFKGRPQTVKRAVRVRYRYALKDQNGAPNGLYATEHLLIGYAGSNG
jgi:hypothetical protein